MKGSGKEFTFFRGKLRLIQPEEHRVSVDLVVFLSRLKGIKRNTRVAELGAGFGFLSLVIARKFGCEVFALERDEKLFHLLEENVRQNELGELVKPVKVDIREHRERFRRGEFNAVVTNPPFFPRDYGVGDGGFHFEDDTELKDFVEAASYLLRDGGYFNILVPAFRLYELFLLLDKFNLPPRYLGVMYPTEDKGGKLCAVSSVRNRPGPLSVDRAIIINSKEGGYTPEVESLLEGFL